MANLRAGLIGWGVMGRNHGRILSNLPGVDFVGIADSAITEISRNQLSETRVYPSAQDLIDQGIDYCVIATPTASHKSLAIQALASGVSCLIEKPVAIDFLEGLKIRAESIDTSLVVAVGHIERYNAAVRELKLKLKSKVLGNIYQISLRRQGPFPMRIADVGVIKDLATHDIDLASWLLESKFEMVYAQTAFKSGRVNEDLVTINGRLSNGVLVNIMVDWLSPLKERKLVVTGENGTFVVDMLNSDLTFYENGSHAVSQELYLHFKGVTQGDVTSYAFEKPEPLLVEHQNFRDAMLGKSSDIVSLDDGLEVVRVADAVIKSSETKSAISV
jgi:UDP-N-acetylglucosamine 3-dehydrogenase